MRHHCLSILFGYNVNDSNGNILHNTDKFKKSRMAANTMASYDRPAAVRRCIFPNGTEEGVPAVIRLFSPLQVFIQKPGHSRENQRACHAFASIAARDNRWDVRVSVHRETHRVSG